MRHVRFSRILGIVRLRTFAAIAAAILAGSIAAGAQEDEEPETTPAPAPARVERVPIVVADSTCESGKRIAYKLYKAGKYLGQELGKCQRP